MTDILLNTDDIYTCKEYIHHLFSFNVLLRGLIYVIYPTFVRLALSLNVPIYSLDSNVE